MVFFSLDFLQAATDQVTETARELKPKENVGTLSGKLKIPSQS